MVDEKEPTVLLIHGEGQKLSIDQTWRLLNDNGVSPTPYVSLVEARWFEDLAFCGCGDAPATRSYLFGILKAIEGRHASNWQVDEVDGAIGSSVEAGRYFVLYVLDAMGLTEHGSSVNGCWLTEKGLQLLRELEQENV